MLDVINFIALAVVSAIVVFHYVVSNNTYQDIYSKIDDNTNNIVTYKNNITKQNSDAIASAKVLLTDNLVHTKNKINEKVDKTNKEINENLGETRNSLQTQINTHKEDTKKTLDNYFDNLAKQVTTKSAITGSINLGNKFKLSGVGDGHSDDDWLRVMNAEGKDYYGGVAMNKLWVGGTSWLNENLHMMDGKVNFAKADPGPMIEKTYGANDNRYGVGQFPNGAMRMYTGSGHKPATAGLSLAKANGTLDDVLTIDNEKTTRVHGDLDVQSKIHFGKNDGSSDPYTLEKVKKGVNNSSLRLTINDDRDEAFEIYGDSCLSGDCSGAGSLRHRFVATGDAEHEGNVSVKKRLYVNRSSKDQYPSGWDNGIHSWDVYANGTVATGQNGQIAASMNNAGEVKGKTLCIEDVCINKDQLQKIKSQAKL
jgi:F0F1-type ATP synthase membrane subunit b/b'